MSKKYCAGPNGCQMTMGGDDGLGSYYECNRTARFTYTDTLRGTLRVCGLHSKGNKRNLRPIIKPYVDQPRKR